MELVNQHKVGSTWILLPPMLGKRANKEAGQNNIPKTYHTIGIFIVWIVKSGNGVGLTILANTNTKNSFYCKWLVTSKHSSNQPKDVIFFILFILIFWEGFPKGHYRLEPKRCYGKPTFDNLYKFLI